ncbi:hypothetical protein FNV43_RR07311 [Rhamnella rubrinervis]|uniref:Uncharacterized protein n=1 Tax=Rhamnella rubrinervis TaxID=2594499 RepID=A0A8K0HFL4_9ROSA|nr:hypothetical protein FNV43_RR07311 [Rhamnella rubrinervis]
MRRPCWAKHYPVISAGRTCKSACRIILWITISIWAPRLEEPRETCGSTATLLLCAAIFIVHIPPRCLVDCPNLCMAVASTVSMEVAIGSAPDTCCGSPCGHLECPALASVLAATATGVGTCPDSVMAFVANHKGGCIGGDEEEREELEVVEYQGALHVFSVCG